MITEDYVSFETAKLLKKKGFMDGAITKFFASGYDSNGNILSIRDTELKDYPRPTLQMAMKWLREKRFINPVPYALSLGWAFEVFDLLNKDITGCTKMYSMDMPSKSECYNSYEDAADAAIKYCLENFI
jgi:hypothetical protein